MNEEAERQIIASIARAEESSKNTERRLGNIENAVEKLSVCFSNLTEERVANRDLTRRVRDLEAKLYTVQKGVWSLRVVVAAAIGSGGLGGAAVVLIKSLL